MSKPILQAQGKPIIAVDIDDVLTPHFQDLVDWYNGQYGTNLTLAHNHSKSLEVWGTKDEQTAIKRVQRFFDTEEFRNALPFREAHSALQMLSKKYDLVVVTARDTIIEELTRDWLNRHFEEIFQGIHFTAQYNLNGLNKSKADVLASINAQYLIDDAPNHIDAARVGGTKCVLFGDYPWNQAAKLPEGVVRCKDWAAVLEYFDGEL